MIAKFWMGPSPLVRHSFSLLLATATSLASAAHMVAVPQDQAVCRGTDAFCYEWKLIEDPSLRFVATGYEDGSGFYLCRRRGDGHYGLLFAVHPVLVDPKRPGMKFWGYPWDIRDVVLHGRGPAVQLLAAFAAEAQEDDQWVPPMQRHVPHVLFVGSTTQPDIRIGGGLRYTRVSLAALQRQAMGGEAPSTLPCLGL
jgi:hypothetical protein